MEIKYAFSPFLQGRDIKQARKRLGLTQQAFAELTGVSQKTIERWESSDKITGPIIPLIRILSEQPQLEKRYQVPEKKTPLRLYYYYRNELCTIIDVDDQARMVEIRNYTDFLQFRAFGIVEHPDYAQYEEFLESRCFPRTRDKMKIILKEMGLPFYDPFLIIEKTEGRMAEDDFWIRIER